ncbi:MAG: GNAT family N-acetyltransferase [Gammaproteobacteria bacterium]
MNAAWTLARAEPADLERVLPLVAAYHAFEHIGLDEATRRSAVMQLLGDDRLGTLWLVHHGNELAGYVAICPGYSIEFAGCDAFVDEFWIAPAHRGQGGGRAVLELVKQAARAQGIRALHLEVARDNARARRLYRACGFDARERYVLMSASLD